MAAIAVTAIIGSDGGALSGTPYSLSDGTYCYYTGEQGLGMVTPVRVTEKSPYQDGHTDLGFRLDARRFALSFWIQGASEADLYSKRRSLERILRPRINAIRLKFTMPDTSLRQIDCHCVAMDFPTSDREGFGQNFVAAFEAPDPLFYNPVQGSFTFAPDAVAAGMTIPTPIPTIIGRSILVSNETLTNPGDWPDYPVVIFNGPIVQPKLINRVTDTSTNTVRTMILGYKGTVPAGDSLIIDTNYATKRVVNQAGQRLIHLLTDDSTLSEFWIESGAQELSYSGGGYTPDSTLVILWEERYGGL